MVVTELLPTLICALVIIVSIVVTGIYGTKARIRYVFFTSKLRREGKYEEWAKVNRVLLVAENFSLYACVISFLVPLSLVPLNGKILRSSLLFALLFFCLLGMIPSLVLYRRVPKE